MTMKPTLQLLSFFCLTLLLLLSTSSSLQAQCEVDAGEDITVCEGETVVLGGSPTVVDANPGYSISWDNGAGTDENPSIVAGSTTTYTVELASG